MKTAPHPKGIAASGGGAILPRPERRGLTRISIKATGRGAYCRTRPDKYGFPLGYLTRQKRIYGFATGDLVRADVPRGKKTRIHIVRVAVRATGSFNIQTCNAVVQGIGHKYCRILQRGDGYGYAWSINPGKTNIPVSSRNMSPRSRADVGYANVRQGWGIHRSS